MTAEARRTGVAGIPLKPGRKSAELKPQRTLARGFAPGVESDEHKPVSGPALMKATADA